MTLNKETFRKMTGAPAKEEFFERHNMDFHKCKHHVVHTGKDVLIGENHTGMIANIGKNVESLKKRKLY